MVGERENADAVDANENVADLESAALCRDAVLDDALHLEQFAGIVAADDCEAESLGRALSKRRLDELGK